jgi:sec-independent protein translocase protein TatC
VAVEEKEMSFIDHLEELRWHIIRALGSIFIFAIIAFFNKSFVYGTLILGPAKPTFWTYRMLCKLGEAVNAPDLCVKELNFTLMSREMTAQFTMHLTQSFIIGLVLAFPYAFWEVWRFVKPGLLPSERTISRGAVFFVSALFLIGICFGYYVVAPLAINFLVNYQLDSSILNQFDISSYMSILIMTVLACGIMFQLPMVIYALSKLGLVTPAFMKTFRRHSYLVILIVAAIITPSPDIFSQLLVAIPLFILYEASIVISARVNKARERELMEFESAERIG